MRRDGHYGHGCARHLDAVRAMASQFETASSGYTVRRVRSAADLSSQDFGERRGISRLPNPIAVMEGPASIFGPATGMAAEVWSIDIPIPATPDVAWVLVSSGILIAGRSVNASKAGFFVLGNGDSGSTITYLLSGGIGATTTLTASDGTYNQLNAVEGQLEAARPLWIPVNPASTQGGTTSNFTLQSATNPTNANDFFVNFSQVRFLGFPDRYWENGALFMGPY